MKSPFLLVYKAIKYSHIYIFCIQKKHISHFTSQPFLVEFRQDAGLSLDHQEAPLTKQTAMKGPPVVIETNIIMQRWAETSCVDWQISYENVTVITV